MCDYLFKQSETEASNFRSVLIVISPLKALMENQLREIRRYGISCQKLHTGLSEQELFDVGQGKFQILISSPESLNDAKIRLQLLQLQKQIVCMAVDEAHCVLQWLV